MEYFFLPNNGPRKTIHNVNFLFNTNSNETDILNTYKLLTSSWNPMVYTGKKSFLPKTNYRFTDAEKKNRNTINNQ